MNKVQTISAIVELNPMVNPAFLAEFNVKDLDDYLHRLETVAPLGRSDAHSSYSSGAEPLRQPLVESLA